MGIKRVTKKEASGARLFAESIIRFVRKNLKTRYRFSDRKVGSGAWNIILRQDGQMWDIDYKLHLTKKSKAFKENGFKNPGQIKLDFFNVINNYFQNKSGFTVQNSTTSITILNYNSNYSLDFVIIKEGKEIIRRSQGNNYVWNELPLINGALDEFKKLQPNQKTDLIENYVLPRKKKEIQKNLDDPTKRSSSEILIEEINNYLQRVRNK